MASPFRANPGPDVDVAANAPAKAAPIEELIPAISSSAWNVFTFRLFLFANSCKISVAGVIGYQGENSKR